MEIKYLENVLTAEALITLRKQAGWNILMPQAQKAIENTLFSVAAFSGGEVVGIGRLVGDGALVWYIEDIVVNSSYRRQGIATVVINKLMDYARKHSIAGSYITIALMAAKGKEGFYKKFGFRTFPSETEGAGMALVTKI